MNFYDKVYGLCKEKGISVSKMCDDVGISRSVPKSWKDEHAVPRHSTRKRIADYFTIPVSFFDDEEQVSPSPELTPHTPNLRSVPRLGQISCGLPLNSPENFEGFDEVPKNVDCDYTLKCKGDSMIGARIYDGDLVYIKCMPIVENGEVAAVLIDGEETTLKRIHFENDSLTLCPENDNYKPITFTGREINRVQIIGKVVGVFFGM